jgi:TolB-like protein
MRNNGVLLKKLLCASVLVLLASAPSRAQHKFYNYYNNGLEYEEKGDWLRALSEFKSAASLEFEDTPTKRTYGTRFIEYYPHREIGIAHYNLGEFGDAKKELELSTAYKTSERAQEYLKKISGGVVPTSLPVKVAQSEPAKLAAGENSKPEPAKKSQPILKTDQSAAVKQSAQAGSLEAEVSLTYDPNRVTQIGSRLALAVVPFEGKGDAKKFVDEVTEKMITKLVNLRRFKVIERSALDKIMKEQKFQASGIVDEKTVVQLGKISGADAMIVGSITFVSGIGKVSARVIDVETTETIAARDASISAPSTEIIDRVVENVAAMIYNDLPLVEGYVVKIDQDMLYIDIGLDRGVRKGTKCVVFREGESIKHPITGEVLGKKVTKLGELVVIQVQDKLASVRTVEKEEELKVGDKVVVK